MHCVDWKIHQEINLENSEKNVLHKLVLISYKSYVSIDLKTQILYSNGSVMLKIKAATHLFE